MLALRGLPTTSCTLLKCPLPVRRMAWTDAPTQPPLLPRSPLLVWLLLNPLLLLCLHAAAATAIASVASPGMFSGVLLAQPTGPQVNCMALNGPLSSLSQWSLWDYILLLGRQLLAHRWVLFFPSPLTNGCHAVASATGLLRLRPKGMPK